MGKGGRLVTLSLSWGAHSRHPRTKGLLPVLLWTAPFPPHDFAAFPPERSGGHGLTSCPRGSAPPAFQMASHLGSTPPGLGESGPLRRGGVGTREGPEQEPRAAQLLPLLGVHVKSFNYLSTVVEGSLSIVCVFMCVCVCARLCVCVSVCVWFYPDLRTCI